MEDLQARAFLIVAVALAAALPLAPAQGEPQVTDPPDDARENDSASTAELVRRTACRAGGTPAALSGQCAGAAAAPAAGGDPAPPTMEAISATLWDDPRALHVALELKEVAEGFDGAVRGDGTAGTLYTVCWTTSQAPCSEAVLLAAMPSPQGVALTAVYRVHDDACNDYGTCSWRVPYELTLGSPGRVTWSVPRDLLPNGTQGTVLAEPMLKVTRYLSPSGRIVWPMEDGVGYSARGPVEGAATAGYAANHYVPVDDSLPGADHRLATPAAPADLGAAFDALADLPDDVVGGARPDLDVLSVRFVETDTTFTVAVEVAAVDTRPRDHDVLAAFALDSGRYVAWGYAARGGLLAPHAEVCATPGCYQSAAPNLRAVPLNLTASPGMPGWVNATFARAALGDPPRGSLVGSMDVTMFAYDERATQRTKAGATEAEVLVSGATDTLAYAPPWRFQLDTRPTMRTTGTYVEDALGDADLGPAASSDAARFDVAYVEAVGATPTTSRVTLGIADLSDIDVPPGSRGFLYAVSFELESGQTAMVGFLRTAVGPDAEQEFFCSEDVVLFAPEVRDPDSIIRRTITGLISRAPGGGAGAGQRGSLILEVPHDCFGLVEEGPVRAKRMAAGAFRLPLASAGPVAPEALDTVDQPQPFVLHAAAVQAPAPPWYAEPFGIAGFWDILGIASAVGASIIGVVAVRRKRSLLKRYLARVDAIALQEDANPGAQEKALVQLRHEVKEALILSKLDHPHYVLIDHRLDEALSKARVKSLAATFDDLPARMLKRLQDLLVDGQMSREDYRVFCLMLDESSLNPEAKDRVRRRLEAWVRQDTADEAAAKRAEA